MLTTTDLIARMTPTALAETIVSLDQYGNLDAAERATMDLLREVLECNVGRGKAEELVSAACGPRTSLAEIEARSRATEDRMVAQGFFGK